MTDKLFDLQDKIAVITGASRGIGEATAKLLATHGATVICSSRNQEGVDRVAGEIVDAGGKAVGMVCHVGEVESIERLFAGIEERFGGLDILVNNAAANPHFGPILETPLTAFEKTVDVNIRGYFYCSVHGGRLMKARGQGGAIVNTASITGVKPGAGMGVYSITKAAIINMTQAFAKECGSLGIRVNTVLPGLTDTRFASPLVSNENLLKAFLPSIPLDRVAEPEEIAPAILFLASPAASYVTGACFTVDGGSLVA